MDLGRWGITKFARLTDGCRSLNEFLAEVLEGERSLIEGEQGLSTSNSERASIAKGADQKSIESPFEFNPRNDVRVVLASVPTSRIKNVAPVEALFSSLADCFEAGFLVRRHALGSRLDAMFVLGKRFRASDREGESVAVALPSPGLAGVVRTRSAPILRAMGLDGLRILHDASAFAFEPIPGHVVILVCGRPHPWQVTPIEEAYRYMRELLGQGDVA